MLNSRTTLALAAIGAAAMLVFALAGGAPDPASAARGGCANADAPPRGTSTTKLEKAVKCLIAEERAQAGLKRLGQVGSIDEVAEKHTKVMIAEDCLAHQCGDEQKLKKRIVKSGYPIPGGRYGFAEVTGCSLTPQDMVDAWMRSSVHRDRILGPKYRDIGIGAGKGRPDVPGCTGALRGVYTVIFAWRKG